MLGKGSSVGNDKSITAVIGVSVRESKRPVSILLYQWSQRRGKKSPPNYPLVPFSCQFIFCRFIQRRDEKRPHAAVSTPVLHWGLCSHRDNRPASHPRTG